MSIGKNIKQARKRAGMTQKELGEKLGISQAAVGQFEKENSNPKLETLRRIAIALNVDLDELVDDFFKLPEIKRAVTFSDINRIAEYLNEDIVNISSEKKKKITNCIQKEIDKYENASNSKEHAFELAVKYSHYILNCLLDEYSNEDVSDIILLLSHYLALNEDGKDKISDYAIDIYGNPYYQAAPPDRDEPEALNAANDRGATPEEKKNADDIMHDPDEWE